MAIVRMLHVAIGVADVERSLSFYRDLLGFTVLARDVHDGARIGRVLGADAVRVDAVLLRREGFLLQLLRAEEPRAAARTSALVAHLALAVDDLASTLHSLRARGVAIEDETLTEHAPGVLSCVVRDPDGLAIVLSQAPSGVASAWDDDPLPGG